MGLTMETYSGIMIEWSLLLIFNEKKELSHGFQEL